MSLAALIPTALRPPLRAARDQLTRAGRVRAAWRRLSGPGGRYPAAGRLGGQEAVAPYIHAGPVGGVPTRLLIASSEGQSWYTGGDTHAAELDLFARRMVGPGDVVFDLGANQGVTAIGLARLVGRRGRVYAFDPFPMNCDLIRFNCRLNGIRNVEVVEVGLGDRAGTLAVSAHQQCLAADSPLDPTPVRVETLDAFAHLRPRFVKMDIEGAEVSALAAAGRLLAQRPNLYVELHRGLIPRFGRQVEELADLLPADGYATAGLWTAPDALTPITRASLRDLPHNCGHVLMTRD